MDNKNVTIEEIKTHYDQQLLAMVNKYNNLLEENKKTIIDMQSLRVDATRAKMKAKKYLETIKEIKEFCITYSDNHACYETVYKSILRIIDGEEKWN